jgi:methyl-accepting chemotaxis protein
MRFRRDALFLILVPSAVLIAAMSFAFDRLTAGMTDRVEEDQYALMESIVAFNLRGAEDRALARAEIVASTPSIRAAFAAQDREALLRETRELYRVQSSRYGMDQAAFHTLPSRAFLRLHAPALHGDDLRGFRPLVVAANRTGVPHKGISISRAGPAIFGVVPMRDLSGRRNGVFEIAAEPGPILDRLKAAYGLDLALFIEERPLRQTATELRGDVLNDENRVGAYVKIHATNWALLRQLVDASRLVRSEQPVRYWQEANGAPYGVTLIPLRSGMGQPIGVMLAARSFESSRAAVNRARLWQALIALLAFVVLSGVVLTVVRGLLLRPLAALTDALRALANGDTSRTLDKSKLAQEMADAAESYERVREKLDPGEGA